MNKIQFWEIKIRGLCKFQEKIWRFQIVIAFLKFDSVRVKCTLVYMSTFCYDSFHNNRGLKVFEGRVS